MEHKFEQYYAGDLAWMNFVSVFEEDWQSCSFQKSLLDKLGGHLDLAKVVFGIANDSALKWVHIRAPALDELSAVECVEANLQIRLRSMLMRMPL